ncbi:MAG: hypothetical protein SPF92_04905 [Clostridia bacterium]|nr:hypothetical protein [Clostridia bacterium]
MDNKKIKIVVHSFLSENPAAHIFEIEAEKIKEKIKNTVKSDVQKSN